MMWIWQADEQKGKYIEQQMDVLVDYRAQISGALPLIQALEGCSSAMGPVENWGGADLGDFQNSLEDCSFPAAGSKFWDYKIDLNFKENHII